MKTTKTSEPSAMGGISTARSHLSDRFGLFVRLRISKGLSDAIRAIIESLENEPEQWHFGQGAAIHKKLDLAFGSFWIVQPYEIHIPWRWRRKLRLARESAQISILCQTLRANEQEFAGDLCGRSSSI
jgi:hypothetical protein